ncbi:antistasin [Biomphalaria glabrata]|nr:antistasin [Biomphalaria glabrata]
MSDTETECLDCLCGAHQPCDCTRRMPLPPVSLTSYLKVRQCVITDKCRAKCASSPCKTGAECNNGGCSSCDDQTPRCPGLKCSLNCPNGFVLDSSGCPICRCKCPATPTICLMGKSVTCGNKATTYRYLICGAGQSVTCADKQATTYRYLISGAGQSVTCADKQATTYRYLICGAGQSVTCADKHKL